LFNDATYHQVVRDGLKLGPVLVCVAAKEYARSLACSKCGSVPRCECGGKLHLKSARMLSCSLCGASPNWRCPDCSNLKYILLSKGAARIGEEFRKSFPNIRISVSTSEKPIEQIEGRTIVIATAGMEPDGEFGSVVFLDAQYLQNLPELRSEERLRRFVFSILSKLKENGSIYLDLSPMNRLSRAVNTGNSNLGLNEELEERKEAKLPPFWRMFRIEAESISRIFNNLSKDNEELEIFYENDRTALLRVAVDKGTILAESLYLLQKYRSMSRKPLMAIEVDPYKL
jgi:primosomal protein N' (replication factor Y)